VCLQSKIDEIEQCFSVEKPRLVRCDEICKLLCESEIENDKYSTTRVCYKLLDENGKIKEEYKFKINIFEFGTVDSKILAKKVFCE